MTSFQELLEATAAPAYAVDGQGVIVFANAALCEWISLSPQAVIGRRVAYHSEPAAAGGAEPLTGLCPPPTAPDQPAAEGTLSTMGQDGKLRHRRAWFVWLVLEDQLKQRGVIAIAETRDLTPQQLAQQIAAEPTQDQLHRDIRRFRRSHQEPAAAALLLGHSPVATSLRSQFDLALRTGAGVVVMGCCPADTAAIARAIHYAQQDGQAKLWPVDLVQLGSDEALRIVQTALSANPAERSSLLLVEASAAPLETQAAIAQRLSDAAAHGPRVLATMAPEPALIAPQLLARLGPVRIDTPPLADRVADLSAMTQYYIERSNADRQQQIGGASPDALDQLAVYDWPHGVTQLGEAVAAACAACQTHQISPGDLPPYVRQAVLAASLGTAKPKPVVLDDLLQQIERELVQRALDKAGDNKAEAARLLGLTRQRLYRRLESLGLAPDHEGACDEQ